MTAISADRSVAQCLVRVLDALVNEFGQVVPGRIIEGVVHEACERVMQGSTPDEEQLLLQTCRISLQARVDLGHG